MKKPIFHIMYDADLKLNVKDKEDGDVLNESVQNGNGFISAVNDDDKTLSDNISDKMMLKIVSYGVTTKSVALML